MKLPRWSLTRLGVKRWIVSGLGMGYMPVASGTFGSAVAVGLALAAWGALAVAGVDPRWMNPVLAVAIFIASALCVRWGPWAVEYYATRSRKAGDPGVVVIDEFAGQWLSLMLLPMGTLRATLGVLAVQFVLFRIFDVIKPPPAGRLERFHMGWGILLDDLAAAVYANIAGQILFRLILQ